jgi:hypothetical protein
MKEIKKKIKSPLFFIPMAKIFRFLSSNFMNFCRNIHRSVWQLLGVAKIQNGGRCHGNQGAKHVKFTPDSNNFAVMELP